MYQRNFNKVQNSKNRNKLNISLLQKLVSLGEVPVRISSNRDKLAGITVVVQERDKVKREECREELEKSVKRDWIQFCIFRAERLRETRPWMSKFMPL